MQSHEGYNVCLFVLESCGFNCMIIRDDADFAAVKSYCVILTNVSFILSTPFKSVSVE